MPNKRITIDLSERLKQAFGFIAAVRSPKKEKKHEIQVPENVNVFVKNNVTFEEFRITGNGFDLEFGYTDFSKSGNVGKIFAPPPMISYSREKIMEVTNMDGSDNEVTERYGKRSWDITIQGLLIDLENHEYPSEKVRQTRLLFDTDAPFDVSGQIWDDLDVKSIYFYSFDISGVQGFQDTMQYTLRARSIKPVQYLLTNRDK